MTDPQAKQPAPPADPEPKPEERPAVNYENPRPCEPIRPSPMFKRLAY